MPRCSRPLPPRWASRRCSRLTQPPWRCPSTGRRRPRSLALRAVLATLSATTRRTTTRRTATMATITTTMAARIVHRPWAMLRPRWPGLGWAMRSRWWAHRGRGRCSSSSSSRCRRRRGRHRQGRWRHRSVRRSTLSSASEAASGCRQLHRPTRRTQSVAPLVDRGYLGVPSMRVSVLHSSRRSYLAYNSILALGLTSKCNRSMATCKLQ